MQNQNNQIFDTNFRTLHFADLLFCQVEKLELKYFLKDQLLRAASSVVLNLSEGNARSTKKDRKRLYNYAYSSAKEVQSILKLAKITDPELIKLCHTVCACSYRLWRAL